jgi:PAS domain S-box-containing protein
MTTSDRDLAIPTSLPSPEATEALRVSEEKFAKAFRISPDAVLISSFVDGRIIDANDSFFRITGYARDEVIGRLTEELGVWRNMEDRVALLEGLQANRGSVRDLEFEFQNRAGQRGIGLVSAHLIEIGDEQCLITIARDITVQKRAAQALQHYAEDLKKRNEELDAFAHTAAHDLKNPLANIIGFVEWLDTHPELPDNERQEYLRTIGRNAMKMDNIIDELLLLAQVRKAEVELSPIDMTRIIAEARARLTFLSAEKQAVISLPDRWPSALGHAPWVEEVWVNYLSNAIKYGGQPPCVELGCDEQPDDILRFWVRDNGHGIPVEEQAELFTAFGENSKVRATGHGLGLSIVRTIVEKMGGHVGVESAPGHDSTFYFTLPATP